MDVVYNLALLTIVAAAGDGANAACVLLTLLDLIPTFHSMSRLSQAFTLSLV
jgi:hypothetical protein